MRRTSTFVVGFVTGLTLALLSMGCVDLAATTPADEEIARQSGLTQTDALVTEIADEAPAARTGPVCAELGEPSTPTHRAMFAALNQYREENGLSPLIYSRRLEAAADAHARNLWERGFFAHIDPDGKNPGQRAVAAGFCHQYVGENIAAGQTTVENVMIAWKNSPGHDANMLEPLYVYVGVSYSVDASGRRYWAQEFAYELP